MSHMISPRMSADAEVPEGMPITQGSAMARSGNTSGQLSSQAGSSQLNRSACLLAACAVLLLLGLVLTEIPDFLSPSNKLHVVMNAVQQHISLSPLSYIEERHRVTSRLQHEER